MDAGVRRWGRAVCVAAVLAFGPAWAECVRQGTYVRTKQLEPRLRKGEFVHVYAGQCDFRVERGSVVMLTGRTPFPQLRIVRGLPGDTVLVETRGKQQVVLVNGVELRNSAGRPYRWSRVTAEVMREHLSPFGGKLPPDAYLVLGDRPDFTLDPNLLTPARRQDLHGILVDERELPKADAGTP
ncbi:MAG: Signal peptidase peptidase [Pseudomonadota bacterium]